MNRKFVLTCAAAVAVLGLALAPVTASAKSHNGSHHSSHKSHKKHSKHAHHHHKHHKWHHHKHAHHHHKHHKHWCWHHKHHHHCKKWWVDYETTYNTTTPTYTYSEPNYVYTKPAPSCTCLTKEYAPDGTVIFKDVCTKEMAVSEPSSEKAEK